MVITKVIVARGATINLGNYESSRYDITLEADLEPDDTIDQVQDSLEQLTAHAVVEAVDAIKGSGRGSSPRRFVEGQ